MRRVAAVEIELHGPAGRLEALLDEPQEVPIRGAAVLCHPHPLHRGTMRNTVLYRTARALRSAGLVTLRFNFRGVEGSQGEHDGQGGEEGDVSTALDFLGQRYPGVPLWAAGYSFGARTVASFATVEARIRRLILIALPVAVYDCSFIECVPQPGLMIFGGADEFGGEAELRERYPGLPPGLEVHQIEAADHFFKGRTPLVEEAVRFYAQAHIEEDHVTAR